VADSLWAIARRMAVEARYSDIVEPFGGWAERNAVTESPEEIAGRILNGLRKIGGEEIE